MVRLIRILAPEAQFVEHLIRDSGGPGLILVHQYISPMHPVTISGLSQHLFSTGTESLSIGKIINLFGSKLGILGVFPNWEGSVYQTQLKEIDGPENIHVHMSISTGLGPVLAKYIFRQCIVTSFFHA